MKSFLTFILLFSFSSLLGKHHEILHLPGNDEPGGGKTIVLVAGDEEYRTEESMPMLAKILSQKHGFECKVLFPWDKDGKYIDPNNQQGVRGWHHLKDADLMLIGTRFRRPAPEEAKHITYRQLFEQVCQFANVLKKNGLEKGDRVCIYMPMVPELAVAPGALAGAHQQAIRDLRVPGPGFDLGTEREGNLRGGSFGF